MDRGASWAIVHAVTKELDTTEQPNNNDNNRGNQVQMRSLGPYSRMTSVLIERGNVHTDTHTGRRPRDSEGRGQGDVSTSWGKPEIASKCPGPGKSPRTDPFSTSEGIHPPTPCFRLQFSSVAQSCLTLCDPMDCSTPGLPVHHQLLEFTQTHVHWVGDAIQPSHPLSSPSFLPSVFPNIRVFSNESALRIRWPNIGVSASTPVLPMNSLQKGARSVSKPLSLWYSVCPQL